MTKLVIALAYFAVLFVCSSTYVISPDMLHKVLISNAFTKKAQNKTTLEMIDAGKAICTTPECVVAASELIQSMDLTADPCEDFFQYACGGWIDKHPIPDKASHWNQFDVITEKTSLDISKILTAPINLDDPFPVNQARDMYAACMDTDLLELKGLKPLTDFLDAFGGWPMTLGNRWDEAKFDWQSTTAAGFRIYNFLDNYNVFLAIENYFDILNTSRSIIYIDQASFILPRATLVDPTSSSELMNAYAIYITEAAKATRDYLNSGASDSEIEREVESTWKFESELAKITATAEERRNFTALYNTMLLRGLQNLTNEVPSTEIHSKINWSKFLNEIYEVGAGINIPDTERVVVSEPEYLKKLVNLLDTTSLRTIANYVHWRFVYLLSSATTQQMRDLQFAFHQVLYGTTAQNDRSTACADSTNSLLGFAVSNKYVENNFQEQAKLETELLISNLKTAFKTLVDELSWMDGPTKAIAREKADSMVENIAYPDWIMDKTELESYYDGVIVTKTEHFNNYLSAKSVINSKHLKTLRGPTDRTRWRSFAFPTVVNGYYEPQLNAITFPASILQGNFFGYGRLAAQNYGGIGGVIGHEITHGFDDLGRQFDKNGNIRNWWSAETLANYLNRTQCFIDQYNNYYVPSGSHVNGVTTQSENIADNGGLREAFRAYQFYVAANGAEPHLPGLEQFTSEQLFFIQFANNWCGHETPEYLENQIQTDFHSPSRFRLIGPLSNNVDFVREFNCPAGSPMNRENKCVIW